MCLACQANRRRLLYWAFINSVTNFSRRVSRTVESNHAYFGHTVSVPTRHRMMARIIGNDKKGLAENNTLVQKQMRLLRPLRAIIFAYDNFQRGMGLQHQQGDHSSAFSKGTHQCCHKVVYFDDKTFDACYVDFTQYAQVFPSPWGMPAFELVDMADTSDFLLNYGTFESVTTPDFSGARVASYIELRDVCVHLCFIDKAFPSEKDDDGYLSQCPSSFNTALLHSFRSRCNTNEGRTPLNAAKTFQIDTVC